MVWVICRAATRDAITQGTADDMCGTPERVDNVGNIIGEIV